MPGRCGRRGHRGDATLGLDARDQRGDELVAHRLLVGLREEVRGRLSGLRGGDLLDDRRGVLVARVETLEVDEGDAAVAAQADREVGVGDGIHGRRQERDLQAEPAELAGQVDLRGVDGHGAGDERHLVEAVGAAQAGLGRVADGSLIDQRRPPRVSKTRAAWRRGLRSMRATVTARIGCTLWSLRPLVKYTACARSAADRRSRAAGPGVHDADTAGLNSMEVMSW